MLIRCENCGKPFDYDKNEGVCPACARYQSQPGAAVPQVRGAGGASTLKNAYQRPAGAAARPQAPLKKRGNGKQNLVLTGVLALLLVVLLAAGAAARLPQPAAPVFEAPVQRLAGALPARFELAGAECRVTGAQTLGAGYTTGVQPGYELIRVGFERGAGFEWEGSWDDSVYLAVNGGYVEPVDGYELERLYPELAEAALSSYDVDAYGGAEGYFYFLVPQGTREVDICFEQASDAGGERAVQKVLQLTVSLEEGVA